MQLKIKRSEVGNKFRLEVRGEFTEAERLRVQKMPYYEILKRVTSDDLKDVTKKGSVLGAVATSMFPELRGVDIAIHAGSIEHGHILESRHIGEVSHAEAEIKERCQNLHEMLRATSLYQGQEQVVDFGGGEPTVVARAEPPPVEAPAVRSAAPPPPPPSAEAPPPEPLAEDAPAFAPLYKSAAARADMSDGAKLVCVLLLAAFMVVVLSLMKII